MPGPPGVGSGVAADVPVDLTREQAQRLAELELSDPAYRAGQPGWLQRGIEWLVEWVQRIAEGAGDAAPGGWLGILGLVLLTVVVALFVRWRVGPVRRSANVSFTVDPGTTSTQYRAHAEELAAAGRWDEAISERMRALVRGCQERGLIDTHPGWTADEVAQSIGERGAVDAAILGRAARAFDDVRYGGRPGSADDYAVVTRADTQLRAAPSRSAGTPGAVG